MWGCPPYFTPYSSGKGKGVPILEMPCNKARVLRKMENPGPAAFLRGFQRRGKGVFEDIEVIVGGQTA
jgi:hypothetical protein